MQTERQKEYNEYLRTADWKSRKEKFKKLWGNKCVMCGEEKGISMHHLNYDCLGKEKMQDIMPLCKKCHFDVHKNRLKIWIFTEEENKAFKKIKHIITDEQTSYLTFIRKIAKEYIGKKDLDDGE